MNDEEKRRMMEEMDEARDQAHLDLFNKHKQALSNNQPLTAKTLSDWYKSWYLRAGHKRLGRILVNFPMTAPTD